MNTSLLLAGILGVAILVGAGCGPSATPTVNQAEQASLTAQVALRMDEAMGSPAGQDITLSGAANETFFVPMDAQGQAGELVTGTEVGRKSYPWGGAQYDLVFVQNGQTLQIRQEVRGEMGDVATPKIVKTLMLPVNITVTVE
jgi:hypothetical protein